MPPENFDPRLFLAKIEAGELDGNLQNVINELSLEQLEQVAFLMAQKLLKK